MELKKPIPPYEPCRPYEYYDKQVKVLNLKVLIIYIIILCGPIFLFLDIVYNIFPKSNNNLLNLIHAILVLIGIVFTFVGLPFIEATNDLIDTEFVKVKKKKDIIKEEYKQYEKDYKIYKERIEMYKKEVIEYENYIKNENIKKHQLYIKKISSYNIFWRDMQNLLNLNKIIKIYHFTDRANLASIKTRGGIYSWHHCQTYNILIPKPGGSQMSWNLDRSKGLHNYVRTSFVRDHPMMYVAQQDGRISNPVILEIDIEMIYKSSTLFSTQNAAKSGVTASDSFHTFKSIRFDLFKRSYFNLTSEEKSYYQAEVLILEKIPLEYITNINSV